MGGMGAESLGNPETANIIEKYIFRIIQMIVVLMFSTYMEWAAHGKNLKFQGGEISRIAGLAGVFVEIFWGPDFLESFSNSGRKKGESVDPPHCSYVKRLLTKERALVLVGVPCRNLNPRRNALTFAVRVIPGTPLQRQHLPSAWGAHPCRRQYLRLIFIDDPRQIFNLFR